MSGKQWLLCLALCVLCSRSLGQEDPEATETEYRNLIQSALDEAGVDWDSQEASSAAAVEAHAQGANFDCPLTSGQPAATSVHELTPYDIKVMGAMGDSVTAAFGADAKTIFGALTEFRGVSWSVGGDKQLSSLVTLPNVIKMYNPDVKGYSIKTGGSGSRNANFNVAVSGAIAKDMPSQAETLVSKIKADSSIDFENDWKLVTLWIGGNDLCRACKANRPDQAPDKYVGYIKEAIEYLRQHMPRTFVNVVKIIDVTTLADVKGIDCFFVHLAVCSCADSAKDETIEFFREYNRLLEQMEAEFQDDTIGDDFAVVLQPFMENLEVPKNELRGYLAFDCFHFRTHAHEIAATALWNNMLEPIGAKTDSMDLTEDIHLKCPETGYFYTYKNSPSANAFGIESNDEPAPSDSSSNTLGILLGTGIALYIVGMVVVVTIVVVGVRWARRRRNQYYVRADSEKILLVKK